MNFGLFKKRDLQAVLFETFKIGLCPQVRVHKGMPIIFDLFKGYCLAVRSLLFGLLNRFSCRIT